MGHCRKSTEKRGHSPHIAEATCSCIHHCFCWPPSPRWAAPLRLSPKAVLPLPPPAALHPLGRKSLYRAHAWEPGYDCPSGGQSLCRNNLDFLMHGGCISCPLLIYSIISVWTYKHYFILWIINQYYLTLLLKVAQLGHQELFWLTLYPLTSPSVYVCVCVHMHISAHLWMYVDEHVFMCVYVSVHMHVCVTHVYACVCMCVCVSDCVCLCMCVCSVLSFLLALQDALGSACIFLVLVLESAITLRLPAYFTGDWY